MRIGIVGSGKDKFTYKTEYEARSLIEKILQPENSILISGHSPVGGIDIWAEEIADRFGREKKIYAPRVNQWNPIGEIGYKQRNIDIAKDSDIVHVIVVKFYPDNYTGMRFAYCYHCKRNRADSYHVKSGGCWTGWKAKEFGKEVIWHILES